MTVTEKKKEEGKEANRGWLMAVSGGSKQLPIRRVKQEMKEEDLRGWTCKGAEGADWELRKPNVQSSRFALCCLPVLEPNSVEATIREGERNDLAVTDPRRKQASEMRRNETGHDDPARSTPLRNPTINFSPRTQKRGHKADLPNPFLGALLADAGQTRSPRDRSWDCYGTGTTTNTNELFLPTSAPPCILRASILDRPWERFSANNGTPLSSSAAYRGLLLGLGVHGNSSGHNGFANLSVWPLRLSYKGSTKRAS
ncbi:hypothetical protein G5I_04717 [Acromyrmex echinatior]|uniref:Uncharacterized protein n=1 Tax=Acromyrmex echinatior TaxID=103372 RepID=F4WGE3_ACREC|nr:hypothetical protein G5I_04717 [Acromyrmex echinatior]